VTVDAVVYYKVIDPVKAEFEIQDFGYACTTLAQTNLRNLIGDRTLDETLTARDAINTNLREVLDEATNPWGVKVSRVEVQKIDPPRDITEAMSRQMKAERDKRAAILDAEGTKQSQILKAEGIKQSEILRAEGDASSNNQVSGTVIDLATQVKDPIKRLSSIMAGTRAMKAQMGTFGEFIPKDFPSLGSPWLLSGLASLYGRSGLANRLRVANVTISNVPGPQVPLYLAGAQMAGMYPLSIVVHGVALNITVQSYMGQLCFGLIACRRAMPDVNELAAQLERAMQAARALPMPAATAETAAPAPTVPAATAARATKRRKPRLAVVKAVPAKAPRATPARARRRAA